MRKGAECVRHLNAPAHYEPQYVEMEVRKASVFIPVKSKTLRTLARRAHPRDRSTSRLSRLFLGWSVWRRGWLLGRYRPFLDGDRRRCLPSTGWFLDWSTSSPCCPSFLIRGLNKSDLAPCVPVRDLHFIIRITVIVFDIGELYGRWWRSHDVCRAHTHWLLFWRFPNRSWKDGSIAVQCIFC